MREGRHTRRPARTPLRHSLVLRLFALAAVVALMSIVATAWLTVRTTAADLKEEQGKALQADARIADALTAYAATHPDWTAAKGLVRKLAPGSDRRITLTNERGTVLADSSTRAAPLPGRPSTTIDPLQVGAVEPVPKPPSCGKALQPCYVGRAPYTGPPPGDTPIDPRAIGPFALTAGERAESRTLADRVASCLGTKTSSAPQAKVGASGRAALVLTYDLREYLTTEPTVCSHQLLDAPLPSEVKPLAQLQSLVDGCLSRRKAPAVTLEADFSWSQKQLRTTATDRTVASCITSARREQLVPYVAAPALLYVSSPRQSATTYVDLSPGNRRRIAEVAFMVLLLSVGFAAIAGRALVRPLGVLADTAARVREGDLSARAHVRSRNEIGNVADAFNTMAERRERAEELRRAMVGDVAHELRNPVSTIRGLLEAAQDELVPTDPALVASLLEETLLLQNVVQDLRDLAAGDAGELRLAREPVELAPLLAQVAAAYPGVTTDAPAGLVVNADSLRLRQLFGNLVSNAVRHTPPPGRVEVVAFTDRADTVVEVRDTGEGIDRGDLPHVFERFWRADPSRARASGGSGLGLAIVAQLVEAHGGSVAARSVLGQGSTFSVRFPTQPRSRNTSDH